jgi:hypothetical protein
LGATSKDIAFIYLSEIVIPLLSAIALSSLTRSWYWTTATSVDCLAVSMDTTYGYFLLHEIDSQDRFGKVTLSGGGTSITLTNIKFSSTASTLFTMDTAFLSGN